MYEKSVTLLNGKRIPSIGLGVYAISTSSAAQVVHEALKCGYRHFDTAEYYGNEKAVGNGISAWLSEDKNNKREDVFYTTKIWTQPGGDMTRNIRERFEKVKQLGYIDLLLIHSPLGGKETRLGTYEAMQDAVDMGIVKSIGVSNYGEKHIKELLSWPGLKHKPVVNQIEVAPWIMRVDLVDYCNSQGIKVQAYSPLGQGAKWDHPSLKSIAAKKGCEPAQVLISWSLAKGLIPLPKTQNISRLQSNLDSYNVELDEEDIKALDRPELHDNQSWECTDAA
ncbi:HDL305Cp [Eremothecium sinecaudum]|uniref:HDL305Cp n=1 Tax=Eremothecium sinecaudum TaxID=45286 RepID=A0A0X8HS51_9SACH|nr:HDL305Cp [Eremothecium sinecaudum]AMD20439.1 HDL305Cp [Eremothecium sinecaudum]